MKIQKTIARVQLDAVVSFCVVAFFTGCATQPPPLPPNNAADPQVGRSAGAPRNLLASDRTTLAIERQLSATEAYAEGTEKMGHHMGHMPGAQHGAMQGHEQMQQKHAEAEKKALSEEVKKTSEHMKQTSKALKEKAEQMKPGATIYTCPMHPQIRSDKPANCANCGMDLVPKKEEGDEAH
jgi:Heavy metal binding domain